MRKILAISLLNFKQGIRERLFWGVVFFYIFLLILGVLLGKLSPGESQPVLRNAGLVGMELSGLVLMIFSLVFSFYKEKDNHILEVYLSHFSRPHYLSGKLAGYLVICLFYIILAGLGYLAILYFYGAFLWQVVAGFFNLFLKLSIAISFGLVFCCLFSSPVIALLCSLFLYLASEMAYPALKSISLGSSQAKLALFKCLYYILPNMNKLDIKSNVVHGDLPPFNLFFFVTVYSFTYIMFLWLISSLIFLRKEY